jgi:uncharacterized repeat protein (TIGR03803 family)
VGANKDKVGESGVSHTPKTTNLALTVFDYKCRLHIDCVCRHELRPPAPGLLFFNRSIMVAHRTLPNMKHILNKLMAAGILTASLIPGLSAPSARAQTATFGDYSVLYNFTGSSDGAVPRALLQAADGSFYGTTEGEGTIFKMTKTGGSWTFTTLVSGCGSGTTLVEGSDGNFYGTTEYGGSNSPANGGPQGSVFRMTPAGVLTTLFSFNGANGAHPLGALLQGSDGNFYGTTQSGGSDFGTVFKITPAGVLTTLASFDGVTEGNGPWGALVQGSDGNFYGTTSGGGTSGCGTVFKMTPAGVLTTLVEFAGTNGANPHAALVQGSDGNFYGTTSIGGGSFATNGGEGTIFKMTPTGVLTTLVLFNVTNGAFPEAALVQGSDGNFYGTTSIGASGWGTVFTMTPAGVLTTLVPFDFTYGGRPYAALVKASDGNFYGTAETGGSSSDGVIFELAAPFSPVTTLPAPPPPQSE